MWLEYMIFTRMNIELVPPLPQMPHEPDSDDSASEPDERPANPHSESVSMHHKSAWSLQHSLSIYTVICMVFKF